MRVEVFCSKKFDAKMDNQKLQVTFKRYCSTVEPTATVVEGRGGGRQTHLKFALQLTMSTQKEVEGGGLVFCNSPYKVLHLLVSQNLFYIKELLYIKEMQC
jgi:hypothetical protein